MNKLFVYLMTFMKERKKSFNDIHMKKLFVHLMTFMNKLFFI